MKSFFAVALFALFAVAMAAEEKKDLAASPSLLYGGYGGLGYGGYGLGGIGGIGYGRGIYGGYGLGGYGLGGYGLGLGYGGYGRLGGFYG